ncbi:MAG: hypothetical protein PXX77_00835 [Gallionella sp.]|nr:hypothetical protein [Gallionella sp.]
MNTEIWRQPFDAIEVPAFPQNTLLCVLFINIVYCRYASVTEAGTRGVDLHVRLVQAKEHEVAS